MLGERPESADEWERFYLDGDEWKIDDAIGNKFVSGPQLIGARRAKEVLAQGGKAALLQEIRASRTPHWSAIPGFWLTFLGTLFGLIGFLVWWFSWT